MRQIHCLLYKGDKTPESLVQPWDTADGSEQTLGKGHPTPHIPLALAHRHEHKAALRRASSPCHPQGPGCQVGLSQGVGGGAPRSRLGVRDPLMVHWPP